MIIECLSIVALSNGQINDFNQDQPGFIATDNLKQRKLTAYAGFDNATKHPEIYPAFTIPQQNIDIDDNLIWDQDATLAYLATNIPSEFNGPIVLDWRGSAFKVLRDWDNKSDRGTLLAQMRKCATFVREQRPHALVGYYGLPFREYWKQDDKWRKDNLGLLPFLDKCNALFPSIYDLYACADNEGHPNLGCRQDAQKYQAIVGEALKLAKNRPVIPYYSSRYHISTPEGFYSIPSQEMRHHLIATLTATANGDFADGVILFSADEYYHLNAVSLEHQKGDVLWDKIRTIFKIEKKKGEKFKEYFDRMNRRAYLVILDSIKTIETESVP